MTNCERNTIFRATAALDGDNLVITLPNISILRNGDIVRFVIINPITYTNPLGTVSVTVNGTTFPLKTKFANDVRIEQIRPRKVYTVGVGAQTPTMTLLTCIPGSSFSFPTYPAPTATTATETAE